MVRRRYVLTVLVTAVLTGLFAFAAESRAADNQKAEKASQGKGVAAMDAAAENDKYLFVFFWKTNDEKSRAMGKVFNSAIDKMKDRADRVSIHVTDSAEKTFVKKFGVSRAPMPLVVAMAPNGAITGGFPIKFDEKQLQECFVSPCTEKCLKSLQDGKLVLLCVQNEKTQFTQVAMTAAESFKADARYAKATEIVSLNPEDQAEATFLNDLKVDPLTSKAVTVVLAPPGRPIASFVGAVTKAQIVAKVKAGPCAGGKCGPGGCSPKK